VAWWVYPVVTLGATIAAWVVIGVALIGWIAVAG
jgi:hypothetical protein